MPRTTWDVRPDQYLDVTEYLDEATYWVKASALRLIAAQADLVPDDQVEAIAEKAFTVLDQVQAGELRDTPFFAPSAYLAAHEALAALSERLTASQAARLLDILEPLTSVDGPDQYRHTDKSHAIACTGIGRACPQLAERAIDQLLGLLERASHTVLSDGRDLIIRAPRLQPPATGTPARRRRNRRRRAACPSRPGFRRPCSRRRSRHRPDQPDRQQVRLLPHRHRRGRTSRSLPGSCRPNGGQRSSGASSNDAGPPTRQH